MIDGFECSDQKIVPLVDGSFKSVNAVLAITVNVTPLLRA
jgi:hypothetical protein